MNLQPTITLKQVCEYFHFNYNIAQDFAEFGLVPTMVFKKRKVLEECSAGKIEKAVKLCEALEITSESVGVILAMRGKMTGLDGEIGILESEVHRFREWQDSQEPADLEEINSFDDPLAAQRRNLLVEALK